MSLREEQRRNEIANTQRWFNDHLVVAGAMCVALYFTMKIVSFGMSSPDDVVMSLSEFTNAVHTIVTAVCYFAIPWLLHVAFILSLIWTAYLLIGVVALHIAVCV